MKRLFLFLALCTCLATWLFFSWKHEQSMPAALRKSQFDRSLKLKELGAEFVTHRKLDKEMLTLSHRMIDRRKSEWNQGGRAAIPSIIHQIWPQEGPIPENYLRATRTVQLYNPEATYILWKRADVGRLLSELFGKEWEDLSFDIVRDVAAAAILWQHGGVVIDVESEAVHSVKELLTLADCIIGFEPPLGKVQFQRRLFLSSSVIAAENHHPLIRAWLTEMWRRALLARHNPNISALWVTQESLTRAAAAFHDQKRPLFLGPTYFCPVRPAHIRLFRRTLDGEEHTRFLKRWAQTLGILSVPPYSRVDRDTLCVHLNGGRESGKSPLK